MHTRGARLARGWTGAAAATLFAGVSHTVAGGPAPRPGVILLSLALSGLMCTILAGRVLSLWRLVLAVGLSQGLYHWLFSISADVPDLHLPSTAAAHAGHGVVQSMPTEALMAAHAGMEHSSPWMWLGHGVAALLTIVFLRRGERAALQVCDALGLRVTALIPLLLALPAVQAGRRFPAVWPVRRLGSLGVPLLVMRHRGPPSALPAL